MKSPDAITRLNAALEGRYEVDREVGEGGMATVFVAHDLKHNRNVALKVLKPELAAVVGAERFLAEIETTANLQHPHILPLFDSGEADSFLFYVMPYVEGETLRDRLEREKQLPVDEAVRIATDVAEALHSAHEQGVIHRDIKPANILLSKGRPLVADFGIALAVSAAGGGRLTETGLSMGTPYYMSPEQASADREPTPASDVYSLGCVLYEMLVGEPPYVGSSAQAVLAKILMGDVPAVHATRASVPAHVDAAIRRALEKLPADRFGGAQDFARALGDPGFRHGAGPTASAGTDAVRWKRVSMVAGTVAVMATLAFGSALVTLLQPAPRPVARFEVGLGDDWNLVNSVGVAVALSPDGTRIVYAGQDRLLWQRSFDDLEPAPIPGTDAARTPVLSPDGLSVAFFNYPQALKTVALGGGSVFTVLPTEVTLAGIDWGSDGMLYYQSGRGIQRVPATGGEPETVTSDPGHLWPEALPDGRGVLVTVSADDGGGSRIAVVGPEGGEARELFGGTMARYSPSGHVVYTTADGVLMAAPFDLKNLEVTGRSVAMVEGVEVLVSGASHLAVSETGTVLYRTAVGAEALREFVWVTRSGEVTPVSPGETISWPSLGQNNSLRLSPDGRRVAFTNESGGNADIWTKVLPDGPMSRLTFDGALDQNPAWTPDGQSITFASERMLPSEAVESAVSRFSLWTTPANGAGEPGFVHGSADAPVGDGVWSPDGTWLVMRGNPRPTSTSLNFNVVALRPGLDGAAIPLDASEEFSSLSPAISRDGRWLAYSSNETGRHEIIVRPFPNVGDGQWQVSARGGTQPVWANNGRELFFLNLSTRELEVAEFTATADSFESARATTLFSTAGFDGGATYRSYDVAPDDQRFLMVRPIGSEGSSGKFVLVLNFSEELERLVPN